MDYIEETQFVTCAQQMDKFALLNLLYEAEKGMNLLTPATEDCRKLGEEKTQKQEQYELYNEEPGKRWLLPAISGIITVVLGILYFSYGGVLSLILDCLFWTALIVTAFFTIAALPKSQKQKRFVEDEYRRISEQFATAKAREEEIINQYGGAVKWCSIVCPQECSDPRYLRIFISFLETGRADNLKEAQNLFAEYLHGERPENLAVDQGTIARAD